MFIYLQSKAKSAVIPPPPPLSSSFCIKKEAKRPLLFYNFKNLLDQSQRFLGDFQFFVGSNDINFNF